MQVTNSMAANQKSQDIDTLSVRKIFAKGDNNTTIAANSILVTDGMGGTQWVDMSTFQRGVNFNTIETTQSTFVSGPSSSKFAILDGINAGLIPGTGNSVSMYAKAFGQIDVPNQSSIYSFDTYTGTINSNIQLVGAGIVNISTTTNNNSIQFYSPDNGTSSLSTVLGNFIGLNGSLSNTISSFNSPFSTFIYNAISSYSTVQGPLVQFPQLYSTISSFSTSLGQVVHYNELQSTISSFSSIQGPVVIFPQLYSTISSFSTSLGQAVHYNELQSTISSFSAVLGPTIQVPQVYSTISSFSTSMGQVIQYNQLQSTLSSFSTILGPTIQVPQVYSTISSFSTALGPVVKMSQVLSTMTSISTARITDLTSAISSFSTVQGALVSVSSFSSILSTQNVVAKLNTGVLNTSTLQQLGVRQPFIQYGSNVLSSDGGNTQINLSTVYINSLYNIQLTYRNDTANLNVSPLSFTSVTPSSFLVYGDNNGIIHWTTHGNIF
jgi:hypothetical protein